MKPTLLILAAGMGSRYGGLKQVDPVGPYGEAIIDYSIYDAIRAGYGKIIFVIRKSFADAFKMSFDYKLRSRIDVEYVFQELENIPVGFNFSAEREKPWGTGHAVLVAKDYITDPFVVINADDFYGPSAYKMMADYLSGSINTTRPHYCMVGYGLQYTLSEHGHVSRGVCETDNDGYLESIVERTHIEREEGKIISQFDDDSKMILSGEEVVSMNIWGFTPSFFRSLEKYFMQFINKNAGNPKAEFYIPFVVNELVKNGRIRLKVLESKDRWFGVTYKEDRDFAVENIRKLIQSGIYPEKLWE